MKRFLLMRFIQMMVALLILSFLVFAVARVSGDPAAAFVPEQATKAEYQQARAWLGLDKPLYVQYGLFLANAVTGDLGNSFLTRRPVIDSIKEKLPNSLYLAAPATFIALLIGFCLGVMAAVKRGTVMDTFARVVAGLSQSLPSFWIAIVMLQIFVIALGVLPSSGMGDLRHYVMPVACLTFFQLAAIIRLLRSSMLESLDSEFVKLARIKGVSERVIIWKHVVKNSVLPVLSYTAMYLATTVTYTVVIETIFAWPGVGRLAYSAIITRDYPVLQAIVLLTGAGVIMANFVADVLSAYIDPRIRLRA